MGIANEIAKRLEQNVELNKDNEEYLWQVLVGKHFACSMTYNTKHSAYFDLDEFHTSVLAFLSG